MAGPKCNFQILFITGPSIFILSFWVACAKEKNGRERKKGKSLKGGPSGKSTRRNRDATKEMEPKESGIMKAKNK